MPKASRRIIGGEGREMLEGRTLWELIEKRAAQTPDAEMAVDDRDRHITFGEYKGQVEQTAAALVERGIGEGDVVTWQLPTWFESMVLAGALARIGAIQNPILPIYREREVSFCVKQAGSKLIIVPSESGGFDYATMAKAIAEDAGGVDVLIVDQGGLPAGDTTALPPAPTDPDAIRWLFYTSGTTADPKGAQHADPNIAAVAKGMSERLEIDDADRVAMVFPITHIGGIIWLCTSLQTGCVLVFVSTFFVNGVEILKQHDVTLAGAGTVFHQAYLAAQQASDTPIFPRVRAFPGGGAPKPPQLHFDMKAAFDGAGIVSGYGSSETGILTMASINDSNEDLSQTEGPALPGVELKIADIDTGAAVPSGQEGEVRARGAQVMKGYLDESLNGDAFDDEGYFKMGDLGVLNERGMLSITGRVKDIIIRKGENISAQEVENHLFKHSQIADVAVIGVADDERGEMVCAVVVTAEGQDAIDVATMGAYLIEEGLMKQKLPERIEFVDALPRNPTGKVLKKDLRERYR
jgi:acyl-CoA synthetase (AMP-forming)/AMP-acid ligase II